MRHKGIAGTSSAGLADGRKASLDISTVPKNGGGWLLSQVEQIGIENPFPWGKSAIAISLNQFQRRHITHIRQVADRLRGIFQYSKEFFLKKAIASLGGVLTACSKASQSGSSASQNQAQAPSTPTTEAGGKQDTMHGGSMDHGGSMNHSMMMDLSPADANYDWRFIDAMIPHHEGAITMAQDAASKSKRSEIIAKGRGQKAEGRRLTSQGFSIYLCPNCLGDCYKKLAQDIISSQQKELTK